MSNFNLAKKLLPAKKAWKGSKTTFQSKIQKLRTSRAIEKTKTCCINAWNSIRFIVSSKFYALTRRPNTRSRYHFHYHHQQKQQKKSFSAIYVDELFPGHESVHATQHSSLAQPTKAKEAAESSSSVTRTEHDQMRAGNVEKQHQIAASGVKIREKKPLPKNAEIGASSSSTTSTAAGQAWKIPLLPQYRGVDERAEEFISKFHQEMKLEREKSILDFQEMLARSA